MGVDVVMVAMKKEECYCSIFSSNEVNKDQCHLSRSKLGTFSVFLSQGTASLLSAEMVSRVVCFCWIRACFPVSFMCLSSFHLLNNRGRFILLLLCDWK